MILIGVSIIKSGGFCSVILAKVVISGRFVIVVVLIVVTIICRRLPVVILVEVHIIKVVWFRSVVLIIYWPAITILIEVSIVIIGISIVVWLSLRVVSVSGSGILRLVVIVAIPRAIVLLAVTVSRSVGIVRLVKIVWWSTPVMWWPLWWSPVSMMIVVVLRSSIRFYDHDDGLGGWLSRSIARVVRCILWRRWPRLMLIACVRMVNFHIYCAVCQPSQNILYLRAELMRSSQDSSE